MVCKHFATSKLQNESGSLIQNRCPMNVIASNRESITLQTILVTMISIKKQIPLHIHGVKGSHFSTCAVLTHKKVDGMRGQAEVAKLS